MVFKFRAILFTCFLILIASKGLHSQVPQPVYPLAQRQPVPNLHFTPNRFLANTKDTIPAIKTYLPLNFYATHLGAACKVELQMEKQTKLPLRIRLGSKDQVDYLEGKYNRYH